MNTVLLVTLGILPQEYFFFFLCRWFQYGNCDKYHMSTAFGIIWLCDYFPWWKVIQIILLWELGKIPQGSVVSHLPMLISSSVSASPMHSNWKSWRDCENFCTAADRSAKRETFFVSVYLSSYQVIFPGQHSHKLKIQWYLFAVLITAFGSESHGPDTTLGTCSGSNYCSKETAVEPDMIIVCCRFWSSASRFCILHFLRCFSAYHSFTWVTVAFLSPLAILLRPFSSTRHFRQQWKCRLLSVFCFSTPYYSLETFSFVS